MSLYPRPSNLLNKLASSCRPMTALTILTILSLTLIQILYLIMKESLLKLHALLLKIWSVAKKNKKASSFICILVAAAVVVLLCASCRISAVCGVTDTDSTSNVKNHVEYQFSN